MRQILRKWTMHVHPAKVMVMGFAALIILGTILLNMPMATQEGESIGFVNALFTATSATCVTGLIVFDTGSTFSLFGQLVILALIQCGGLGFMTMATMLFMALGRRISLRSRMLLQESLATSGLQGVVKMTRRVFCMTAVVEGVGALLLATRFIPRYGWAKGIYYGIFHSISAFCNAGFDVVGGLPNYRDDVVVNLVIMALVVVGGLGFAVIFDLMNRKRRQVKRLQLHTKVVLIVTGSLIVLGTVFFLALEWNNPQTLGDPDMPLYAKPIAAAFQAITPRTAGFETFAQAKFTMPSRLMTIILMFIGASPASTGGGVKTTTAAVVFLMVMATVRGRRDVTIFKRRLPMMLVARAIVIMLISFVLVIAVSMGVSLVENGVHGAGAVGFEEILFESVSAFGTVGLTMGITPILHDASKILIALLMFAGRVGPLTLTLALAARQHDNEDTFRYAEDRVLVG
nr:TrkH family potassium uptake protein [Maliibacterium massiliense]